MSFALELKDESCTRVSYSIVDRRELQYSLEMGVLLGLVRVAL